MHGYLKQILWISLILIKPINKIQCNFEEDPEFRFDDLMRFRKKKSNLLWKLSINIMEWTSTDIDTDVYGRANL